MLGAVRAGGFRLAGATFLVASIFPFVGGVPAACAAEGPRAVLVVDTGESEHRMCVELPRKEVSGTDLIVLAGEQHGLSYRFGYGGGAVCMLAGVGADGDDCFQKYPDFWGYWRGDGSGGWTWSSSGAGSTRVSDGDVEGWSWGSGNDGSSHPAPPATSFSSVCAATSSPPPSQPDKKPQARPRSGAGDTDEGPAERQRQDPADAPSTKVTADDDSRKRRVDAKSRARPRPRARHEKRRRSKTPIHPTPTPTSTGPVTERTPPAASDRGSGPPAAGVAAVLAAGALGGVGTWFTRRRRMSP